MEIIIAKGAGFCFGVKRAVDMAYAAAEQCQKSGEKIYSLGPIIHNPQVVDDLEGMGVKVVDDIVGVKELVSSSVIFRSHGISDPDLPGSLADHDVTVVDATCPYVKKAQVYAKRLTSEGYKLVIVGDSRHPEVESIVGHCGGDPLITESVADIKGLKDYKKIGIIAQTTQSRRKFLNIVSSIVSWAEDVKILNTICSATSVRQEEAKKVSGLVDVMIVIGGKNSANTKRLADVCHEINKIVYHVETDKEINLAWFNSDVKTVGVTGGASTPAWVIDKVVNVLKTI